MTRAGRVVAVAAVGLVLMLVACGGGGGGTNLAATGPAELGAPAKGKIGVTRLSPPAPDRLSLVATVENGTGGARSDVVVAGDVFDSAGAKVTQGRGQVVTPLTIPKGGVGIVKVVFDAPLPDPFRIEWTDRTGDRAKDAVDLRVTSLDLDASGAVDASVENSTGSRVKVGELDVLCLDASGNAFGLTQLPGLPNKVSKGETVKMTGTVGAGCVTAIAGAIGTKNLLPPPTTTAPAN